MADETDGGSGGTVRLDADTSPFEAALNRAQQKFSGWGDKITGLVDRMNTVTETKISAWADKAAGIAGLASEEIGGVAGGGIGAAIGTFFGGPAGTLIGSKIGNMLGGAIGSNIDLTGAADVFSGLLGTVQEFGGRVKAEFQDISADGSETWGRIKEAWSGVSYRDVFDALFKDSKDAQEKILGAWDATFGNIEDFAARMVSRLRSGIDSLWGAINEPLAKVADFLQAVAVKLGLVEAGTASWGDAIRNIKDVGNEVLGAIAYGFGYMNDVIVKVGGFIQEHIIVPINRMEIAFAKAILSIIETAKDIPGFDQLFDVSKFEAGIEKIKGILDQGNANVDQAEKNAREAQNRVIGSTGEKWRKDIKDFADKGDELNKERNKDKGFVGPLPEPAFVGPLENVAEKFAQAVKGVAAQVEGSAAANQTILRAAQEREGFAAKSPIQRAAEAAAEQVRKQDETNRILKQVKDKLDDTLIVSTA